MLILVDPHSGVPVYRQIVDQVRFQIASGRIAPGDELPSTRALSQRLRVNPMTISKAYGILEDDGVIQRRPGLPLVVAELSAKRKTVSKLDQLALSLKPATLAAVQLGVSAREAGALFRKLVDGRARHQENTE